MQMKKLLFVTALALATLCATSAFGQTCDAGPDFTNSVVGVGSSAQVNTFAYAAAELITAAAGDTGINNGDYNLFTTTTGVSINDTRFTTTLSDSANPVFIMWDNNTATPCKVYSYYTTDSGVGVKDFLASKKLVAGGTTYSIAGANISLSGLSALSPGQNAIPGLTDVVGGASPVTYSQVPSGIVSMLGTQYLPTGTNHPRPYCGNTKSNPAGKGWCVFNFAGTDIRPEDALFAETRANKTLDTAGYAGLGYNSGGCDGGVLGTSQGCPLFDSFGQNKVFNVLGFALSGSDPVTSAGVEPYITISFGASPVVVIVQNADSSGFGATSGGNYTIHDVNRGVLSQVFQGNLHCTGDFLAGYAGAGSPIEEIQREPLSGTYNTFEFTGVRTLTGSTAVPSSLTGLQSFPATATAWPSNGDSGQEHGVNPSTGFNAANCGFASTYVLGSGGIGKGNKPNGLSTCGDPIFITTGSSGHACGASYRGRSIGTSVEVKAAMGLDGTLGGHTVNDGVGYSFWSYGNLGPMATGCTSTDNQTNFNKSCGFIGHYLTVDGIDPLFNTPGGVNDSPANPAGAYNPPQCDFTQVPCIKIPFTHVQDGTYPLWSLLRDLTFPYNSSAGEVTPTGVIELIAEAQFEASVNNRLSDFVPFLKNVSVSAHPTGDLNLGVFRAHYQRNGSPVDGYAKCSGVFTGVYLNGTDPANPKPNCLQDKGGDAGGTVMTVQSDVDFVADFGSLFTNYEFFGQKQ